MPGAAHLAATSQGFLEHLGAASLLALRCGKALRRRPFALREVVRQIELLGIRSLGLAVVTSVLIGMVMGTQFAFGLSRFGGIEYLGRLVGTGFARELAPGLMAIIVGSRIGAGITAELGAMAVTEQVDAIRALGADPVEKLVLPRVLAAIVVLPVIGTLALVLGVLGAMFAVSSQFDLPAAFFFRTALDEMVIADYLMGIAKTPFFWLLHCAHQLLPGAGDARRHGRSGPGDDPRRRRDRDRNLDRRLLLDQPGHRLPQPVLRAAIPRRDNVEQPFAKGTQLGYAQQPARAGESHPTLVIAAISPAAQSARSSSSATRRAQRPGPCTD
jgi:phospholipid/cholesterol/gamma-HCH transport system permease protein